MTSETFSPGAVHNPFAGPQSLRRGDPIYGRERELTDLADILIAERIVWLHSPSGAGKTSLIQAGLIPRLEQSAFAVQPLIRVGLVHTSNGLNRYEQSAVLSLGGESGKGLDDTVRMRVAEAGDNTVLLIFDQFEEVLTTDAADLEAKQAFFRGLGKVLQSPDVWALFVLREEFLPALHPYVKHIPKRMSHPFRLELLSVDSAKQAIGLTAKHGGRVFSDLALDKLAEDLSMIQVRDPAGGLRRVPGPAIEPMQLQVVCRTLWDQTPEEFRVFEPQHLADFGDVNSALIKYYAAEVRAVAGGDEAAERRIRDFFNEQLITGSGVRDQLLRDQAAEYLTEERLARLFDTHLIRAEQRGGRTWVELAHDRLVDPIQEDNRQWLERHLSWVQLRVRLWRKEGRPETLLLADLELERAEIWRSRSPEAVTDADAEFLRRSRENQAVLDSNRAHARRIRRYFRVVCALCVVSIALAAAAWFLRQQARSGELAASAVSVAHTNRELGLVLALEAIRVRDTTPAREALHLTSHEVRGDTYAPCQNVFTVAYSGDGKRIAAVCDGGTVRVWEGDEANLLFTLPVGEAATAVALSSDGRLLAAGDGAGSAVLYDLQTGRQLFPRVSAGSAAVGDLKFASDGRSFATASTDVRMWDSQTGRQLQRFSEHSLSGKVVRIALNPRNGLLASAGSDGQVIARDPRRRSGTLVFARTSANAARDVAWSPDGKLLAATFADGALEVWDAATGRSTLSTQAYRSTKSSVSAEGVAFDPDGLTLATLSSEGVARIWNLAEGRPVMDLRAGDPLQARGFSIAYHPQGGSRIATGGDRLRVFELQLPVLIRNSERALRTPEAREALAKEDCDKYLHNGPCPVY